MREGAAQNRGRRDRERHRIRQGQRDREMYMRKNWRKKRNLKNQLAYFKIILHQVFENLIEFTPTTPKSIPISLQFNFMFIVSLSLSVSVSFCLSPSLLSFLFSLLFPVPFPSHMNSDLKEQSLQVNRTDRTILFYFKEEGMHL